MGLSNTLHQDGILFFIVISSFRIVNIIFTASPYPNRVNYAGLYVCNLAIVRPPLTSRSFVWAMVTVTLNRLLLHIRSAEIRVAANDKRIAAEFYSARHDLYESSDDEEEAEEPRSPDAIVLNGRASPFGIPLPAHHPRGRERMSAHDADVLPTTFVEMYSFHR